MHLLLLAFVGQASCFQQSLLLFVDEEVLGYDRSG